MSLRRKKFPTYNRMEVKEETYYWLELLFQEETSDWNDWDEYGWGIDWWDYAGSGSVRNMNEYHQMRLLTLLRKLNIRTAREQVNSMGW